MPSRSSSSPPSAMPCFVKCAAEWRPIWGGGGVAECPPQFTAHYFSKCSTELNTVCRQGCCRVVSLASPSVSSSEAPSEAPSRSALPSFQPRPSLSASYVKNLATKFREFGYHGSLWVWRVVCQCSIQSTSPVIENERDPYYYGHG